LASNGVDDSIALTFELKKSMNLLKSVGLSLFNNLGCNNLRRREGSRSYEGGRIVRCDTFEERYSLFRGNNVVNRLRNRRGRDYKSRLVSDLFVDYLLALLVLRLSSFVESSNLLFVIHVFSTGLDSFEVSKTFKRTHEASESTNV